MYIKTKLYVTQNISLVAVRKSKITLTFNEASYIGLCRIDLSKILMYEFHYDYIKNKYDTNSRLLFTDTDSLMYGIKTEGVCEDFSSNREMFNVSNYSAKSKCYDNSNKLVISKMRDESNGVAIKEFLD